MDEATASEIEDHLWDVAAALDEAIAAVSHLLPADQTMLATPLEKLLDSLHSNVFRLVYEQHPRWRSGLITRLRSAAICDGKR